VSAEASDLANATSDFNNELDVLRDRIVDLENQLADTKADLDEKTAALERAEQINSDFLEAIETIDAGFAFFDQEDRLVFCNRRYYEIFPRLTAMGVIRPGVTFEEIVRTGTERGLVNAGIDRVEDYIRERMEKHRTPGEPFEYQQSPGKWIRTEERRTPSGGYVGTRTDITAFKEIEHRLAELLDEQKAQLTAFSQHAPLTFFIKDRKGCYQYVNHLFEQVFGTTSADIIGKTARNIVSAEEAIRHETQDEEVWETGNASSFEINIPTAGEIDRWMLVRKFPILDPNGTMIALGGLGMDISDIKMAQEEMARARDQAETANQAKSDFLSSMSHELRTPLNAILGFGQVLMINSKDPLSVKQKHAVEHINGAGKHLMELIEHVLDLAKIEQGKMMLSIEPVRLDDLCAECLTLINKQAETRGLKIESDLGASNYILADRTRMKQCLLNLLSNAVKYNRDGGAVKLTRENISDHMVRLSVIDTGNSINEDEQTKLFQPFSRLGRETGTIEGTGIGLFITKQLVEAMGGSVGFEGKVGKGSTFWIDMPNVQAIDDEVTVLIDSGPMEPLAADATVLYIEDNLSNLQLMEAIISEIDRATLISAQNAELGLMMAEECLPDIILMDINLPGMNGLAAMEILGTLDKTKDIPVIAISANAKKDDIKNGVAAGFSDYLTKPINVSKLIEAIRKSLREERLE